MRGVFSGGRRAAGRIPVPGLLAALLLAGACLGPGLPDPREITFPALRISPPAPERVVRENGTVIHLLPDREVPLVDIQVLIRAGAVMDPRDKVGLAGLAGGVLRTGGSRRHSGSSLSETLEGMGAVLESSIGWESGRVSLSVLSGDVEKGGELLAELTKTEQQIVRHLWNCPRTKRSAFVKAIWKNKAEGLIAQVKPSAYQEAAKYLRKAAEVMRREKKPA